MMRQQQQSQGQDHQSRVLYEISALVLNLLRSPVPFSDDDRAPAPRRRSPPSGQMTAAGFASLMLGVSLALMLCGSVTFFIGFLLMPWVLGLVMLFYVAGIVSTISIVGRSILCYALAPPPPPRKDIPDVRILYGLMNARSLCLNKFTIDVKLLHRNYGSVLGLYVRCMEDIVKWAWFEEVNFTSLDEQQQFYSPWMCCPEYSHTGM